MKLVLGIDTGSTYRFEGAWIIGSASQIAHSYGLPCLTGVCLIGLIA